MLAPTDRQIGAKQFIISIALANLESLLVMIYNFVLHKGGLLCRVWHWTSNSWDPGTRQIVAFGLTQLSSYKICFVVVGSESRKMCSNGNLVGI